MAILQKSAPAQGHVGQPARDPLQLLRQAVFWALGTLLEAPLCAILGPDAQSGTIV